jgi:hypothetical protein
MPSKPDHTADKGNDSQIISPFAQTTSTIRPSSEWTMILWPLWIISGLLVLVILGSVGYFAIRYLDDPYRTMEPFSVDKYFVDYQPLAGSKFKADMKVTADLGWKENTGRLMVFTVGNDARPLSVLIPPKLSGIFFEKGQTYQISLEVGEGGLLYADSCDKE